MEFTVSVDGFEDFYTAIELEGCHSPKVFDFPQKHDGSGIVLRLPGDYIVATRLQPSGVMAYTTLEVR